MHILITMETIYQYVHMRSIALIADIITMV